MPVHMDGGNKPLSVEMAKESLNRLGISVQDFARLHNINPKTVYEVLAGRKKGRRGEAHRAAVLLGIKEGVINDTTDTQDAKPE